MKKPPAVTFRDGDVMERYIARLVDPRFDVTKYGYDISELRQALRPFSPRMQDQIAGVMDAGLLSEYLLQLPDDFARCVLDLKEAIDELVLVHRGKWHASEGTPE